MAEIPTLTVPEVAPRATPAGPMEVRPPPGAFGATVAGESLQGTGKALMQGAESEFAYAKAFQDLNNKAVSDLANSQFDVQSRALAAQWMQNNPGAKGFTPDEKGVRPIDTFGTDLETLRGSIAKDNNLSPIANSMYDEQSRRMYGMVFGNANEYAKSQQTEFWKASSRANIDAIANRAALHPTDLKALAQDQADMDHEVIHLGTLTGESQSPAIMHQNILNAWSKALSTNISAMAYSDAKGAAALLDQYRGQGWISPDDDAKLIRDIHGPITQQIAAENAQGAFNAGVVKGDKESTLAAIEQAESGGRNVINYREARGEKGFTASGYFMINDPTWRDNAPAEVLAKYPRAIDAPHDVQHEVAGIIYDRRGTEPWAASQGTWGAKVGGNPLTNVENNLPAIQATAQAGAAADAQHYSRYTNQAEVVSATEGHTAQQYERWKYTYQQQQDSSTQTLLSQVDPNTKEPISDLNTLLKIPGMQQLYSNLSEPAQTAVQRQIQVNANAWSPQRDIAYRSALADLGTDKNAFANKDYSQEDMTRAGYQDILRRQVAARVEIQRGTQNAEAVILNKALASPMIKLNIPPASDADGVKYYVGSLMGKVEDWMRANPGKEPSEMDYNVWAQQLTTKPAGFFTQPAYRTSGAAYTGVPATFRQQVIDYARSHGMTAPSEAEIEATYARTPH